MTPPKASFIKMPAKLIDARARQLFLDDYCVAQSRNIVRKLHQPKKCGPVLQPESQKGQVVLQSRSVPQWNSDRKLWEWWYWGSWKCDPYGPYKSTAVSLVHYAVSPDGLHWERPNLGLYEWQGSKVNNLAMSPDEGHRSLYHIIRDERDKDPERRYKGLLGQSNRKPAVSADGFTWKTLEVAELKSCDESSFAYDPFQKQFVAIVKQYTVWGRSMALVTSPDFKQWHDHGIVMHADDKDWDNCWPRIQALLEDKRYLSPPLVDSENYIAETYNMAVTPYEGIYVGMVNLFNPAGAIPPPQTNYTGINQVELAVSRDLKLWRRLRDRKVFLGVEPWDGVAYDTQQLLPCGPAIARGDELWIYYNALRFRGHKELYPEQYAPFFDDIGALALAKLRRDGFVSLTAAAAGGEILTQPLAHGNGNLYVNANASRGELRAEILDPETLAPLRGMTAQECLPLREDTIRGLLGWKNGPVARHAAERGRGVRIRFILRNADLYSFWIE